MCIPRIKTREHSCLYLHYKTTVSKGNKSLMSNCGTVTDSPNFSLALGVMANTINQGNSTKSSMRSIKMLLITCVFSADGEDNRQDSIQYLELLMHVYCSAMLTKIP